MSGQAGGAGGLPWPEPALLASGGHHTCGRDQGVMRCWGYNYFGELGTSANNGVDFPNPVPALVDGGMLTGVRQIALGLMHSCALRDDGRVFCWGNNDYAQLGTKADDGFGASGPNPVPASVDHPELGVVKQLALGGGHSCALRDDGRVLCWGGKPSGRLPADEGAEASKYLPALIDDTALGVVKQLALGGGHSCALRDDGRVLCWGDNFYGQVGTTPDAGTEAPVPVPVPVPVLVDHPELGVVRQLALGKGHTCALRDDGRVLCWGDNRHGQLANGTNNGAVASNPVPTLVDDAALGVVKRLALGGGHSCALRDDGRVLCWGDNDYGQLGTDANAGTETPTPVPTLVDDAALGVVRQLTLGERHTCALRDDGRALCWGANDSGQLGTGADSTNNSPNPAPALVEGLPPLVP